jgi:hypothetical protein
MCKTEAGTQMVHIKHDTEGGAPVRNKGYDMQILSDRVQVHALGKGASAEQFDDDGVATPTSALFERRHHVLGDHKRRWRTSAGSVWCALMRGG